MVTVALFLVKNEENGSAVFTKKRVPAPFPRLFINFKKCELSFLHLTGSHSAYEYPFYYYTENLALRI